jgi:hypothetical protein
LVEPTLLGDALPLRAAGCNPKYRAARSLALAAAAPPLQRNAGIERTRELRINHLGKTLQVGAGERLEIGYSYPRERFTAERISALRAHMLQLIDEITADASRARGKITLLTPDDSSLLSDV